jgi:hypothetical protein
MIPDGVKNAMTARRSTVHPPARSNREVVRKPTTKSDVNIATVESIGRTFGGAFKYDAKALVGLQSTLKAFVAMSDKEIIDAVYTIGLMR